MPTNQFPPEMQHAMFTSWPNTPGPARLIRLADHLHLHQEDDPPEGLDSYIERLEALNFRRRAHTDWRHQDTSTFQKALEALTANALQGDTSNTIGLAILSQANPLLRLIPWARPRNRCTISRLPRDPQWMGFDPTLTLVSGLTALVFEGQQPHRPSFVLVIPPGMARRHPQDPRDPFPEGQAQTLADLLRWHQANPQWVPLPQNQRP